MWNHKVLNTIKFELHFCIIVKNGTLKQGSDTKHLTILLLNTFTALLLVLTGQIKVPFRDRAYQCLALWVLSPRNPAEKPRWKSFLSEFEIFEGSRRWKRERGGVAKKLLFSQCYKGFWRKSYQGKVVHYWREDKRESWGGTAHCRRRLEETSGASTGGAGAWRPYLPQHPGQIHTSYSQTQHTCVFVTASHDNNESV